MSIRIAVYNQCQMNENPCSNQEIHVLFEHGSELENTLKSRLGMSVTTQGGSGRQFVTGP